MGPCGDRGSGRAASGPPGCGRRSPRAGHQLPPGHDFGSACLGRYTVSLSQELDDVESPLSRFLLAAMPGWDRMAAEARRSLTPCQTWFPLRSGDDYPWSLIGTAIDNRLRLALSEDAWPSPVTVAGVEALRQLRSRDNSGGTLDCERARRLGSELLEYVGVLVAAVPLSSRDQPFMLPEAREMELARALFVAAGFEGVYRAGLDGAPAFVRDIRSGTTLDLLLATVPDSVVEDMLGLVQVAAESTLNDRRSITCSADVVTGPVFVGSSLVGGADADFVVAGTLIDVKATIRPEQISRPTVFQLISYVLLDFDDAMLIRRVGWYFARQGALLEWSLHDWLEAVGCSRSIAQLRSDVRGALGPAPLTLGPDAGQITAQMSPSQASGRYGAADAQTAPTPRGLTPRKQGFSLQLPAVRGLSVEPLDPGLVTGYTNDELALLYSIAEGHGVSGDQVVGMIREEMSYHDMGRRRGLFPSLQQLIAEMAE